MLHPIFDQMTRDLYVLDEGGSEVPLRGSNVSREEGSFIFEIIRDYSVMSVLEVGCAYGAASLQIGYGLSKMTASSRHVILDPNQYVNYNGIGLLNLERAGFSYDFRETPSELGLPELFEAGETFDMVFVDGYHTFDHTMLDLFYSERVVREGGLIVIDDTRLPPVNRAVRYFLCYPHIRLLRGVPADPKRDSLARRTLRRGKDWLYWPVSLFPTRFAEEIFDSTVMKPDKRIDLFNTMVALQKTGPDKRRWDWYRPF